MSFSQSFAPGPARHQPQPYHLDPPPHHPRRRRREDDEPYHPYPHPQPHPYTNAAAIPYPHPRDPLAPSRHLQDLASAPPPPKRPRRAPEPPRHDPPAAAPAPTRQPVDGDATAPLLSRDEIERRSPSRKDGIDPASEARLRASYCAYLRCLGFRLGLPQMTVATAAVYCHRFFFRRSHACHDRFLVATAALFLASKTEESTCLLNTVLRASCEVSQNQEFNLLPYMMRGQNWFQLYRESVIQAEQMILTTLDFELEVAHPYASLSSALSKLGLSHSTLYDVAWSLINEGLRSSLWLQFKPHHIAAGAAFLAGKFLRYDITFHQNFWHEFKTAPPIVQDVVQQLKELL
ncbi:cyclin-T1-5-like [Lolium rigidum]|uniref:cyclin-T1-5-like n=1 Tax=Lolium rigidum TaxID=89674 RepID=UPI001F5CDFDA|nr:cyclin-T1-5-like [Lolium rigidum]